MKTKAYANISHQLGGCILLFALLLHAAAVQAKECRVIKNIQGLTAQNDKKALARFAWLAFANGKILARGNGAIEKPFLSCTQVDGRGLHLLPGLIDAHGHVSDLGNELQQVQLRGAKSEAQAVATVRAYAQNNRQQAWLIGRGWNQVLWPGGTFPSKQSLDASGIERPVVLERVDGHAIWVNSAALKIAAIDRSTPNPAGGKIVRDKNGEASGVLIDKAATLVLDKMPPPSRQQALNTLNMAFDHLLSLGIVSVHDAGVKPLELEAYRQLRKNNALPVRVYAMLAGNHANLDTWLAAGPMPDKQDFLSIRSVKLYADGALGSRGAALLEPYSDDTPNRGLLLTDEKQLQARVNKIIGAGFQANIHAIGDHGNRLVLDAFAHYLKKHPGQALRHRVEHAQVVSLADIPRFKTLGIIASMQPSHATSDKNMAGDRIGKERLKGAYAWQKFLQQGTVIASGSDFPVEHANPFYGLHAAITRQDQQNQPKGGWLPTQKMTLAQALRSFTIDAAFAAHQEKTLGSIEPGKWADFVLVDRDISKAKPEELWQTRVLETWVAGQQRFSR